MVNQVHENSEGIVHIPELAPMAVPAEMGGTPYYASG
eukprot:CAMPEP_0184292440 /NCGR_PEP_ID=MMETSP1049-20130417/4230_1 /TAXON_ID=77928 /ORGANISM="Proteomonas sulcata, Strain CCMP704" /LENGTH=36 /DNA_ID= /DNA_START= /DNA_END= /DNA_ORIENTATION=